MNRVMSYLIFKKVYGPVANGHNAVVLITIMKHPYFDYTMNCHLSKKIDFPCSNVLYMLST